MYMLLGSLVTNMDKWMIFCSFDVFSCLICLQVHRFTIEAAFQVSTTFREGLHPFSFTHLFWIWTIQTRGTTFVRRRCNIPDWKLEDVQSCTNIQPNQQNSLTSLRSGVWIFAQHQPYKEIHLRREVKKNYLPSSMAHTKYCGKLDRLLLFILPSSFKIYNVLALSCLNKNVGVIPKSRHPHVMR